MIYVYGHTFFDLKVRSEDRSPNALLLGVGTTADDRSTQRKSTVWRDRLWVTTLPGLVLSLA